MTNLFGQVWQYVIPSGWVLGLLGYFVKSSLMLLTALLIQPLLKSRPPAVRHLFVRSAFLGVMVLTLLGPLLPSWQISWPGFLVASWNATAVMLQPQVVSPVDSTVAATNAQWPVWVLVLWLAGCIVAGGRYLFGLASAYKLTHTGLPVDDKETLRSARRIANQMQIRKQVRILVNERLSVPIVFGLWHATVLLPANYSEWTEERRNLVLRHELAHVKRRDGLWIQLAALTSIVHWFNPLFWAARGKMVAASEFACDDAVLNIGVTSSDYAQHLLDCARDAGPLDRSVSTGVALAYNTQLEGRIMSILTNRKRATLTTAKLTMTVTAIMLALALPLVGLSWQTQASETLPELSDFVAVESTPTMTHQEAPVYPEKAKKAGIEGKVWVKVLVDKTGKVANVRLGKTSGNKILDESALKAGWKSTFTPASVDGKPVATWVMYAVSFALGEKKEPEK